MNEKLKNVRLGAPESIEASNCPALENLDVQITERLKTLSFKGNTGTKNPFTRAAEILRQQEVERKKEEISDDSISINIPTDITINGGSSTEAVVMEGSTPTPSRNYYWQIKDVSQESTMIPTIDQRGNITMESGKWAEFDIVAKRYADASWKKEHYLVNFWKRYSQLNSLPAYIRTRMMEYWQNYDMLDYIQDTTNYNNVTRYIETGISAKDTEVYIEFTTESSDSQNYIGVMGTCSAGYGLELGYWNNSFLYINGGDKNLASRSFVANVRNKWTITRNVITLNVNGTETEYQNTKGLSTSDETIKLFRAYVQGTRGCKGSIHVCKLTKQNSLVWQGIPTRRKSDGVLGMYDFVNGVFHENAGTNTFVAGDVIDFASTDFINKLR